MELAHTNVLINPYTMDIAVQANVVRPGFAPFDYTCLALIIGPYIQCLKFL